MDEAQIRQLQKLLRRKKKISFKQYEKEMAQIENLMSNRIASYTGEHEKMLTNVDLRGLDSKKMLDTATHMRTVANDFHGLDLGDIKISTPDEMSMDEIGEGVVMDSDQGSKNIRINANIFSPGSNALSEAYRELGEDYSASGIDDVGQAFTGVHELGHVVNYHLQDRINQDQNRQGNDRLTSDRVARGILTDALTSEANEDQDLRSLLHTHAGLQEDADLSDQTIKQTIANALTPQENNTPSALMDALYQNGYTSGYGHSDPSEMYAEAFAAHYRNEHEKNPILLTRTYSKRSRIPSVLES